MHVGRRLFSFVDPAVYILLASEDLPIWLIGLGIGRMLDKNNAVTLKHSMKL